MLSITLLTLAGCLYVDVLMIFEEVWLGFFFKAEDGIRDLVRSRGLGDVYKRQEPKRCIRGDGALAIHQFADPARRDIDVRRKLAGTDAHGLHEVLEQDLARMNLVKQLGHVSKS